jgi:membrane associated rhomboid family serine protease
MLLATNYLNNFKESYLNSHVIIGASGSLFGLLAAYGMLFPNTLIYIYFFIPMKAKYFVILYGIIELISGFSNNPNDNVAHFAHLGGMVIGIIIILFWRRKKSWNQFEE